MATKYICDRCGREHVIKGTLKHLVLMEDESDTNLARLTGRLAEICKSCEQELKKFLEPLARAYHEPRS